MAGLTHGEAADEAARAATALVALLVELPPQLSERLSSSQLRVLAAIDEAGQTTPTQLAVGLDALPSSITRLCDRLVAAGQVERVRGHDDRRVHVLRLTREGQRLLEQLHRHRTHVIGGVLDRMSAVDRTALLQGLKAFGEATRRTGREESPLATRD